MVNEADILRDKTKADLGCYLNHIPSQFDNYVDTIEAFKGFIDSLRSENAELKLRLSKIKALTFSWVIAEETISCKHTYDKIREVCDNPIPNQATHP